MGTIKLELDLPEFKNEIELKIVINKDGVQNGTPLVYKQVDKMNLPGEKLEQSTPIWRDNKNSNCNPNGYPNVITVATNGPSGDKANSNVRSSSGIPSSMVGNY